MVVTWRRIYYLSASVALKYADESWKFHFPIWSLPPLRATSKGPNPLRKTLRKNFHWPRGLHCQLLMKVLGTKIAKSAFHALMRFCPPLWDARLIGFLGPDWPSCRSRDLIRPNAHTPFTLNLVQLRSTKNAPSDPVTSEIAQRVTKWEINVTKRHLAAATLILVRFTRGAVHSKSSHIPPKIPKIPRIFLRI